MRRQCSFVPLIGLIALVALCMGSRLTAHADEESVPLQDNLGDHTYLISTTVPLAQRYFDQGLMLSYGFNHAEAARSFREAARLDPACAMCYWGEALVLGPNINAPMSDAAVAQAYEAVQKALSLAGQATKKERALIRAVAKRYSKDIVKDRSHLDKAYAEAMRKVFKEFPDDPVIGALLAESLMDLHPWDFWKRNGEPKSWTPEIISVLERVLGNAPNNPLANHLYIHTMEASPHPEKALPSAERLASLVPGSGHLVHMPAHIYIRVGRYRDAAVANQHAVRVDQQYLSHSHMESMYTAAYVPHNYHFLWAAAAKTGQQKLAMEAAVGTAARVNPEAMRDPAVAGTLQHFWLIPLYTDILFGRWAEILRQPEPPADLMYPTGIWHYARGLAFSRKGKLDQAQKELADLKKIARHPALADLKIFQNSVSEILEIGEHVLTGEIAAGRGDYDTALSQLQQAIHIEDGLYYTEPKDWYISTRQIMGALLLETGKAAEAEKVYRRDLQDHPQSGWSLFGLVQSLRTQQKDDEARKVQEEFDRAWADADVALTSSRF